MQVASSALAADFLVRERGGLYGLMIATASPARGHLANLVAGAEPLSRMRALLGQTTAEAESNPSHSVSPAPSACGVAQARDDALAVIAARFMTRRKAGRRPWRLVAKGRLVTLAGFF